MLKGVIQLSQVEVTCGLGHCNKHLCAEQQQHGPQPMMPSVNCVPVTRRVGVKVESD